MIANKYYMGSGKGRSKKSPLVAFDKALLDAGVGNYNLVRLSSILPARCEKTDKIDIPEGSLLPVAYATISSDVPGDILCSGVAIGFPDDTDKVGVIMEYSEIGADKSKVLTTLQRMVREAFDARGWKLKDISYAVSSAVVKKDGEDTVTFACVAEWWE